MRRGTSIVGTCIMNSRLGRLGLGLKSLASTRHRVVLSKYLVGCCEGRWSLLGVVGRLLSVVG